jgi:hypothetical protein
VSGIQQRAIDIDGQQANAMGVGRQNIFRMQRETDGGERAARSGWWWSLPDRWGSCSKNVHGHKTG